MLNINAEIKLTGFSKGSGCGCKIPPAILESILGKSLHEHFPGLLVGNESRDDAAVMKIREDLAIVSTTDFFTPIVDDPFDFGRVAAANALSDIYAMGAGPVMAIAILGWPVDKIPAEMATRVIEGARSVCKEAGIPLAGGHSIETQEPVFGLAVTGIMHPDHVKKNNSARPGDLLFLTKPLGTGILSAASKRGILQEADYPSLIETMCSLNKCGENLGKMDWVHAMTDITGFGFLGHLIEMTEGSGLSAEIDYLSIPKLEGLDKYLAQFCVPDNCFKNWNSFEKKVSGIKTNSFMLLSDPQTSGGLLVAIDPAYEDEFRKMMRSADLEIGAPVGRMMEQQGFSVVVKGDE